MAMYHGFAQVYDLFMDNIPYDEWCEYLIKILKNFKIENSLILELGCGTGNITERLAQAGYDMIGIDSSSDMLDIAMEKKELNEVSNKNSETNILYLNQDMRDFELYGTVSAVVSICDSLNYLMSQEDLLEVFKLVNNYLDAGGIFVFDLNTEYKYKELLSDTTIAENRDDGSFIWENYYYEDEMVNEYNLTIYIKEHSSQKTDNKSVDKSKTYYQRFEETHYQRAYPISLIKELLHQSGMEFVTAYDAFTWEPPTKTSERVYIIAREGRQEKKTYV